MENFHKIYGIIVAVCIIIISEKAVNKSKLS